MIDAHAVVGLAGLGLTPVHRVLCRQASKLFSFPKLGEAEEERRQGSRWNFKAGPWARITLPLHSIQSSATISG